MDMTETKMELFKLHLEYLKEHEPEKYLKVTSSMPAISMYFQDEEVAEKEAFIV